MNLCVISGYVFAYIFDEVGGHCKLKIVICDDNRSEAAFVRAVIEEHFKDYTIEEFNSGGSLLEYLKENSPDIILLDVEMPGLNGLETARKIRETHPIMGIIFITAHAQFALEAFGVYAFDFIVKPVDKKRLVRSLDIVESKRTGVEKYIQVNNRGTVFRVNEKDIIFIEKCSNRCVVYTESFVYNMKTSLKYFIERLDPEIFIRTHSGFVVNRNKIILITAKGNLAYDIHFTGTDKKASLSRGMNERLGLI